MIRPPAISLAVLFFLIASACFQASGTGRTIRVSTFGRTKDSEEISRYALSNNQSMEVSVINYGAAIVSLRFGYDTVEGYEQDRAFFGATIGRYGNRIAGGQFALDNTVFHLPTNDGPNCLHAGTRGFNKRVWTAADRSTDDAQILELSYVSQNGEEGFPGNLQAKVTYRLPADRNEVQIEYWATTDKDTVINLTNHSYFNLSGEPTREILSHQLHLYASKFTSIDVHLIPTGISAAVQDTPFDFTKLVAIGARIEQDNEQLKFGRGYDHNWVLDGDSNDGLQSAAEVFEPGSG